MTRLPHFRAFWLLAAGLALGCPAYGQVLYIWTANYTPEGSGQSGTVIKRFQLWDTRFSDSRRTVVFDRETDDLSKIQGLLFVEAKPQ